MDNAKRSNNCFGSGTSSSESKIYFDAIDKALEILEHDRELAEKVPSCVVVGMQSVGKSAILSRISGIRFPQDSEVCTRVATELRLRRARGDQDTTKPMSIKAGNSEAKEVDKSDQNAVENLLKEAQTKVLNGKPFEDKLSIKVEKEDVDLPEVTLIDLPGVFFAKDNGDDYLEEEVKKMIQDRVCNEMALILHVVPLNQDTDTISTWRTVRDADEKQERTILVLTKADLALQDKDGRDKLKKRIQKIRKDSKSTDCFLIHGAAKSFEDEELQLSQVSNYIIELGLGGQIKVGVKELNGFIEERMLEHTKNKIPEMRRLLESELSRSKEILKKVGRELLTPNLIALHDYQRMKRHLDDAYKLFQSNCRHFTEQMSKEIFEIDLKPLGIVDANEANKILSDHWDEYECSPKDIDYQNHVLALEVKKFGEDSRGFINIQYAGNEPELVKYLESFVEPLMIILKKFVDDVFWSFHAKVIQQSIRKGSSEPTKGIIKQLDLVIQKDVIGKVKGDAIEYVKFLVDSVKENTLTCNEHYLADTTKALEAKFEGREGQKINGNYWSNMQMHYRVVCGIRAFFKARKKLLPDTIQLHITKTLKDLFKTTDQEISDYMLSEKSTTLIKESSVLVANRKFHLEREEELINALKEISLL